MLLSEKERVDSVEKSNRNVELSKPFERDLCCLERFRRVTWRSGLKVKIKSFFRCCGWAATRSVH